MEKHLNILAVLNIAVGVSGLIGAGFVLLIFGGGGLLAGDPGAAIVVSGFGTMIAGLITVLSLPSLIAGIAMLRRSPIAHVSALVAGGLNLINIPFGTPIGLYALWVFLHDESAALLSRRSVSNSIA